MPLDPKLEGSEPVGNCLLEVKDLKTYFYTDNGVAKEPLTVLSFSVAHGQAVGIVGESGCGKSVIACSIMRLVDYPGKIVRGTWSSSGVLKTS